MTKQNFKNINYDAILVTSSNSSLKIRHQNDGTKIFYFQALP